MGTGITVRVLLLSLLCGCHTAPKLPPVNLQAPGWTVRQGQAVWTAKRGEHGVAGELLLATRADGACLVQFAKPPFTLATARSEAGSWCLEVQSAGRAFGGRGTAPREFVWFALVDAVRCPPPARNWRWDQAVAADGWRLTSPATGETLEGYWSP